MSTADTDRRQALALSLQADRENLARHGQVLTKTDLARIFRTVMAGATRFSEGELELMRAVETATAEQFQQQAALAEQQRDEAIRQRQVTAGRMSAQIEQLRAQVEQLRGRNAVLQDFHDRIAETVDRRRADR